MKKKFRHSLKARFFLWHNLCIQEKPLHIHACSFGEVKSIEKIAQEFDTRISVITQTGFEAARKFCKQVNFLAFENFLPFWLKPCKVLVIFEAELWLMLVFIAKLKGAKTLLINARISERSFKKYLKFKFLYQKIFSYIDEVWAQSKEDKTRLEALGAKNVKEFFNIKAALEVKITRKLSKPKEKLIVFASTHEREEELLLSNFNLEKGTKLIIAPRHPERFEKVFHLLTHYASTRNLTLNRFSALNLEDDDLKNAFTSDILLIDNLGELINLYAISDVVVLGGSFFEGIGGHNPIEVAHFNNVLISGKFIHNQHALFECVSNVNFCENIKDLHTFLQKTQQCELNKNLSLEPIISSIKEGIHAR